MNVKAHKKSLMALCIAFAFLLVGGLADVLATSSPQTGVGPAQGGIIVPLYSNPCLSPGCSSPDGRGWAVTYNIGQLDPSVSDLVIVNVNSSAGSACNAANSCADFQNGIRYLLQNHNVRVVGYVDTACNTTCKSIATEESLINNWYNWYGPGNSTMLPAKYVVGIFFDDASSSSTAICISPSTTCASYESTLNSYVKNKWPVGVGFTVANPGTNVDSGLVGVMNVQVIWEGAALPTTSYLNSNAYPGLGDSPDQFASISYNVSGSGFGAGDAHIESTHAGWIDISNTVNYDSGCCSGQGYPYDGTGSYIQAFAGRVDQSPTHRLSIVFVYKNGLPITSTNININASNKQIMYSYTGVTNDTQTISVISTIGACSFEEWNSVATQTVNTYTYQIIQDTTQTAFYNANSC